MFPADFVALIFQLTPSALQGEKHSSNHLDKDYFSGVFAWGCYCSNNHTKQHPEQQTLNTLFLNSQH